MLYGLPFHDKDVMAQLLPLLCRRHNLCHAQEGSWPLVGCAFCRPPSFTPNPFSDKYDHDRLSALQAARLLPREQGF
jgi:hypothetical protein